MKDNNFIKKIAISSAALVCASTLFAAPIDSTALRGMPDDADALVYFDIDVLRDSNLVTMGLDFAKKQDDAEQQKKAELAEEWFKKVSDIAVAIKVLDDDETPAVVSMRGNFEKDEILEKFSNDTLEKIEVGGRTIYRVNSVSVKIDAGAGDAENCKVAVCKDDSAIVFLEKGHLLGAVSNLKEGDDANSVVEILKRQIAAYDAKKSAAVPAAPAGVPENVKEFLRVGADEAMCKKIGDIGGAGSLSNISAIAGDVPVGEGSALYVLSNSELATEELAKSSAQRLTQLVTFTKLLLTMPPQNGEPRPPADEKKNEIMLEFLSGVDVASKGSEINISLTSPTYSRIFEVAEFLANDAKEEAAAKEKAAAKEESAAKEKSQEE